MFGSLLALSRLFVVRLVVCVGLVDRVVIGAIANRALVEVPESEQCLALKSKRSRELVDFECDLLEFALKVDARAAKRRRAVKNS
jgi:hypothetical protein